jgi:hypothetical protein
MSITPPSNPLNGYNLISGVSDDDTNTDDTESNDDMNLPVTLATSKGNTSDVVTTHGATISTTTTKNGVTTTSTATPTDSATDSATTTDNTPTTKQSPLVTMLLKMYNKNNPQITQPTTSTLENCSAVCNENNFCVGFQLNDSGTSCTYKKNISNPASLSSANLYLKNGTNTNLPSTYSQGVYEGMCGSNTLFTNYIDDTGKTDTCIPLTPITPTPTTSSKHYTFGVIYLILIILIILTIIILLIVWFIKRRKNRT